jgi:16S rRNA (cytidine1402-2'-O)-methyltransferase
LRQIDGIKIGGQVWRFQLKLVSAEEACHDYILVLMFHTCSFASWLLLYQNKYKCDRVSSTIESLIIYQKNMNKEKGTLSIVATPIGNISDMTLRAIETLKSVDLIACEDTRVTGNLLKHFEISKPLISYFQHSKIAKIEQLIEELNNGKNIALVSDAGTPGISDPGQYLISQIRDQYPEIKVVPIPGVSAVVAATSVSGLVDKEYYFAGFLPKKKGRETKFKQLNLLDIPIVIYESANRLEKTMEDIRRYLGEDTEVFIAREITKMFEEYWGGKIDDILKDLKNHQIKGEIVLIIKKLS